MIRPLLGFCLNTAGAFPPGAATQLIGDAPALQGGGLILLPFCAMLLVKWHPLLLARVG